MASSGNFDTLSNLDNPTYDSTTNVPSQGNLKYTSSGNNQCTAQIPLTFKSYCEVRIVSISNYGGSLGFGVGSLNNVFFHGSVTFQTNYSSGYIYVQNGALSGGGSQDGNAGGTVSAGDIVMMAYDPDTFKWWVGKNGTWNSSGDPGAGSNPVYTGSATQFSQGKGNNSDIVWGAYTSSANGLTCVFNFGQDSTFGGLETAGGNADGNGHGDFQYAPPTGFLANCAGNMPISEDIDPAKTDDDNPQKQFGVATYTGNGSTQSINIGFKPDLLWFKNRGGANSWVMFDSTRGTTKTLNSNATSAESTGAYTNLDSFTSTGFDLDGGGTGDVNQSSANLISYCWRANGGTTSSNSSGDITSTVQANTKAGFSIATYTGNGSVAQSIGHGLSSGAPEFILVKNRSQADAWAVYHVGIGNSAHLILDTNSAQTTGSAYWGSFTPTTTLFKVGNDHKLNASSENYIAYLWHGVEGYSKFGSYKGNGNDNGPYIRTGFRPKMFFIKNVGSSSNWHVYDTERSTFNVMNDTLNWNDNSTEQTDYAYQGFDVLSNGIKVRGSNGLANSSGVVYIYGAWGDVPFKYNNTF